MLTLLEGSLLAESELAMFGLIVLDKELEHIVDGVIEIRRVEEK